MARSLFCATAFALFLAPGAALACACGCGIFDVGDGTFMPNNANSGFSAWFRVANMDQNRNWEGSSSASAADNSDNRINTTFYFVGGQYVINRDWSVMVQLPIYDRAFTSTDDGTVAGPAGSIYRARDTSIGDLETMVMYTGFAKDMSTGLGFGVKAPTGDWHGPNGPLGGPELDRDTLPGAGSTDLILTGYHVGTLNRANTLGHFVQAKWQIAIATQDQYRPGNEFDSAVGVSYDLGSYGPFTRIAPVLQFLNSLREHDTGANADFLNSGYERVLIDPGISVRLKKVRFDADVAIPIYQHTNAAPSVAIEGTSGQLVAAMPKVGAPAPAVVARTLDGQGIDLSKLQGRVVVVNVWATWCAPCRAEMPMLNTFFLQHRDANVLLVGLSADRSRDKGDVRKAMSAFAYPAALLSEAKVDKLDEPRVLPITYVIDKAGVVRAVFGGSGTPLTAQRLADAIRPLL